MSLSLTAWSTGTVAFSPARIAAASSASFGLAATKASSFWSGTLAASRTSG